MKLVALSSVIIVALLSTPTLGSPMESLPIEVSPNKLVDLLLTYQWIEDRFNRLENELATVKEKNSQQEKEIVDLKEKVFKLESKGSKEKNSDVTEKGFYYYSPGGIKSAIAGPSSCQDVEDLNPGLTISNFYIVRNVINKRMMVVYCSFDGPVVQTFIGNLDMKTVEVHFDFQRTTSHITPNTIITFDFEQLNIGGAMDGRRGIFTAPVDGIYHFSFSGAKDSSITDLNIEMHLNGFIPMGMSHASNLNYILGVSAIHTSLKLRAGDTINLYNSGSGVLYDTAEGHFTHFEGWLQEEELVFA